VISDLVSNLFYDIIEVVKSKILPLRFQTDFRHVPRNEKALKGASFTEEIGTISNDY
jgi:hypothetical protein